MFETAVIGTASRVRVGQTKYRGRTNGRGGEGRGERFVSSKDVTDWGSEAHLAFYSKGTGVITSKAERPGRDYSPTSSATRKNAFDFTSIPIHAFTPCTRTILTLKANNFCFWEVTCVGDSFYSCIIVTAGTEYQGQESVQHWSEPF